MAKILLEDQSLRDGLQFEHTVLSLSEKMQLFSLIKDAGVPRIQVGSFVHPTIVPQMADSDTLVQRILPSKGSLITGLVLNRQGLERAISCGLSHISLSASVSDAHSLKNVNKSSKQAIVSASNLIQEAVQAGVSVRAGLQCVFGCNIYGPIAEGRVLDTFNDFITAGATEVNLADTTGMAIPAQVKALVEKCRTAFPMTPLSLHLHDTRGLGLANMLAGYECGVRIFDTSAGGLGGCPFVRGAAGNVATEDAVNLFTKMGVSTAINLEKMCKVTHYYEQLLGKQLPGRMLRVTEDQK